MRLVGVLGLLVVMACNPNTYDGPEPPDAVVKDFALYTHCGIDELEHDGFWYRRHGGSLSDGNGNPPDAWGNPTQVGTLTITNHVAVFTDDSGHREQFDWQPGQKTFSHRCA